jgi:uncharacterized protein YjbI with pentapeptide repeats
VSDQRDFRGKPVQFKARDLDLSTYLLERSQITNSSFLNCMGEGANFDGATLLDVRIEAAPGYKVPFADASFNSARLDNVHFGPRGLDLSRASFAHARLTNVTFKLASLEGADFSSAILKNCLFTRGHLNDCAFRTSTLVRVSFEGAVLSGADFTGATFKNMDFYGEPDYTGAVISDELRYAFGIVTEPRRRFETLMHLPDIDVEIRDAARKVSETYPSSLDAPEAMFVGSEMKDIVPAEIFARLMKALKEMQLEDHPK